MLDERRGALKITINRLSVGVDKLVDTNEKVAALEAQLTELQPVLKEKAAETEVLLEKVAKDQAAAAIVQSRVEEEAAVVGAQAEEVSVVQADAQADLDKAMPALAKAIKSLDKLSKSDITEVKSFAKPPPAVQIVMEAVSSMDHVMCIRN